MVLRAQGVAVESVLFLALMALAIYHFGTRKKAAFHRYPAPAPDVRDPCNQLRYVMDASFRQKRIMSPDEYAVFKAVEVEIRHRKLPHRVFSQVCLGEVIGTESVKAFESINSKRTDILVIDGQGFPVAAIEYQGSGHYQGNAAARDAVKKEALRRAGVPFIEVYEGDSGDEIRKRLCGALNWATIT